VVTGFYKICENCKCRSKFSSKFNFKILIDLHSSINGDGGAVGGIVEQRCMVKGDPLGAARDLADEANVVVEL
jgi:hypothetical protein